MAVNQMTVLLKKLNPTCQEALLEAEKLCNSRRNEYVEPEHWLTTLVHMPDTDVARLLHHYDVNVSRLQKELTAALDRLRRGSDGRPGWSLGVEDGVREAWLLTSLQFNTERIRSGYLLTALLTERGLSQKLLASAPQLSRIPTDKLIQEVRAIIVGSVEDKQEISSPSSGASVAGASGGSSNLDQYTTNLTERARKGEIDPVVGREAEIRQVIDILMRRRQNNPILTGEAGVGKTAVVEGFALRLVAGDVPPPLRNVLLHSLDLGLLQAGAGVKGEFENRLKGLMAEVKASPTPIVLFIDEAHTVIGAGGPAGSGDAANLLKPALARGELRTIAATTWAEYKKFFEEDPALKRRFQVVKVDEPDIDRATRMMRTFSARLEVHHRVRILDEAIDDAVKLSQRYITDRQLPDKAVTLLDTACARVALSQSAMPAPLEDCCREIDHTTVEVGILEREAAAGSDHAARLDDLKTKLKTLEERRTSLDKRLLEERKLVTRAQELRARTEEAARVGKVDEAARAELSTTHAELVAMQGENPLVQPVVGRQTVAEVVSAWTGIPVGKMVLDEIKTALDLKARLEERVIGQAPALEVIAERMRTARAQLLDPNRPIGVFLLVGPSGVGKTETAHALSDILYGGSRNMVVINMSEYKEEQKISRLTGSAPGYVGFGQGGVLTEAVRRKPYSIVLLDEIEKAHQSVQEIFYQVFDKGTLQDDRGNEVDFKNTIILLTSNAGTDTIMRACADPDNVPDMATLARTLRPDLLETFKPALLGRMAVVPYFPLADEVIRKIVRLQLQRIGARLKSNHKCEFVCADNVIDTIAGRCKDVESGARNVDAILTGTLLPSIAQELLTRLAAGKRVTKVSIGVNETDDFTYEFAQA
jgi:type VI secretion system protein VasG